MKMSKYWKESRNNKNYFQKTYSKWLSWTFLDLDNVSLKILYDNTLKRTILKNDRNLVQAM